jgi:hypothetical protein
MLSTGKGPGASDPIRTHAREFEAVEGSLALASRQEAEVLSHGRAVAGQFGSAARRRL